VPAHLEGPLLATISLVESSLKTAHQGEYGARALVQLQRQIPVKTTEYTPWWKHTSGETLSRRLYPETCAHYQKDEQQSDSLKIRILTAATSSGLNSGALRRDELHGNNLGPILQ
jgi:hypothetical protein